VDIAKTLNTQKKELLHQVSRIDAALHALFGTKKSTGRRVSAAAKRKMSLAAKKRWAVIKSKQKKS
jgi:hypothetical protein